MNLFAAAAAAAAELVRAGAAEFEEPAVRYARLLMECQQTEWPDWDEPIRGFCATVGTKAATEESPAVEGFDAALYSKLKNTALWYFSLPK